MTIAKYLLEDPFLGSQRLDGEWKDDVMLEMPRFQVFAHRSIYLDGWRAVCPFRGGRSESRSVGDRILMTEEQLRELDASGWELYNLLDDPGETRDLADSQRTRLLEMISLWYATARKHDA